VATPIRVVAGDVETDPVAVADRLARRLARRTGGHDLAGWTCRPVRPTTRLPPGLAYLAPRTSSPRTRRT
jgi:hypothetical protein